MQTICKYPLDLTDQQTIELPIIREILDVQFQNGVACIWVKLESDDEVKELVTINTYGTGHLIPRIEQKYIGTYQDGNFVFHVFEDKSK